MEPFLSNLTPLLKIVPDRQRLETPGTISSSSYLLKIFPFKASGAAQEKKNTLTLSGITEGSHDVAFRLFFKKRISRDLAIA